MMLLAALLALAAQTDRAGNVLEVLSQSGPAPMEPGEGSGLHCSVLPRWCVSVTFDDSSGWRLRVHNGDGSRQEDMPLPTLTDRTRYTVWPNLIRNTDGSIMVGVLRVERGAFSGGGWLTAHLVLVQVAETGTPAVLELPFEAAASVRACFGERDRRNRRNACSDEYSYAATIAIDPAGAAAMPILRISTSASTYPGRRSRTEDSSQSPPLRRQDLIHWRDPACSFVRSYRFDAAAGHYLPDSPVPACADYLDLE